MNLKYLIFLLFFPALFAEAKVTEKTALQILISSSDEIVIGEIKSISVWVSEEDGVSYNNLEIEVLKVAKGSLTKGKKIKVSVTILSDDIARDYPFIKKSTTCIFFLKKSKKRFVLASSFFGIHTNNPIFWDSFKKHLK